MTKCLRNSKKCEVQSNLKKIRQKLGMRKKKLMAFSEDESSSDDNDDHPEIQVLDVMEAQNRNS